MLLIDAYPEDITLKHLSIGCISLDDNADDTYLNLKELELYGFREHMTNKIYLKISKLIGLLQQYNRNKQGQEIRDVDKYSVFKNGKINDYVEHIYLKCTKRLGNVKYYRLTVYLTITEWHPKCKKVIAYSAKSET